MGVPARSFDGGSKSAVSPLEHLLLIFLSTGKSLIFDLRFGWVFGGFRKQQILQNPRFVFLFCVCVFEAFC